MNPVAGLAILYAGWPATNALWLPKTGQGKNGRAIHDQPGQLVQGGEVFTTEHSLRYPVSTFPSVRQGDQFIVDGSTYTVTDAPLASLDGVECTVSMAKVA